ncbi:Hvo_1808 family surface protein [Halobiforma nitratireducens]|uniref:PGF-CTERM archaeal protein-sorting signal n=1 Tax=Halobiforma nitratireducens JCM 10879 TaxID=1227454 RepID=M0MB48_9EURY|nr:Hvo_1808 family surface protein [Halobiforma nitratireducens]EMA41869.1 hypothetical protein C446_04650 [Halobiforma nitratireducens JCM 10879]
MQSTRTRSLLVVLAVVAVALLAVAVVGLAPAPFTADEPGEERTDGPSTSDTVGYVEGYWYDDELPVDERDDASLEDDELEAVVYRSMARVETIRELPFEEEVPVEVIDREEFQERDDVFVNLSAAEQLHASVTYEATFLVDRETDASEAVETLYGGAVDGYYTPTDGKIVIVSNTPDTPEMDEVVLGHELLHALQDQHFDLTSYDRETLDQDNAKNGLIEGDAVWVDGEYADRCDEDWDCVLPADTAPADTDLNWGLYLTIIQPYEDGPDYVEYLLEQGGWDAVDEAYDDPPPSSSAVIRPGEERVPADLAVPDRSGDDWTQFEIDGDRADETLGEAGMVAMFAAGAFEAGHPAVIDRQEFLGDGYDYDQPYTDGWAGDELVTYVTTDASVDDPDRTDAVLEETGFVWRTEWLSEDDAAAFTDGYLELLEFYGAEPVADRQDTYVVEGDSYPGAYYLERDGDGNDDDDADGETVTIVRAPSVEDLPEIEAGAAPDGEDEIAAWAGLDGGTAVGGDTDAIGGIAGSMAGSMALAAAVVVGTGIVVVAVRRRRRRRRRKREIEAATKPTPLEPRSHAVPRSETKSTGSTVDG